MGSHRRKSNRLPPGPAAPLPPRRAMRLPTGARLRARQSAKAFTYVLVSIGLCRASRTKRIEENKFCTLHNTGQTHTLILERSWSIRKGSQTPTATTTRSPGQRLDPSIDPWIYGLIGHYDCDRLPAIATLPPEKITLIHFDSNDV